MSSDRRTIFTLAVLAVALLVGSGLGVWLLGRPVLNDPQQAGANTTQRLAALQAGLEAAAQYVNTEHDEQAATILEKLAKEFPDEPQVWQQLAEVRLHQGRQADAYAIYTKVIDLGVDSRDIRFNAGLIAARLDRIDEAIIHLQQARRLAPTDVQAPLYLASLYRKTNEIAKAQAELLHVIDIDKDIHEAWGGLAQIAFIENKLELAEQHLAKARTLAPQFTTWQVLEAKILRRRGKPEAAITLLSALPEQARYQQEVVDEIGQCWGMLLMPRKAAETHVEYLNRRPESLSSAVAAARFFELAGDHDGALSWLAFAQRLDAAAPEVEALARQLGSQPAEAEPAGDPADDGP